MMTYFGKYSAQDETYLSDESEDTCTDLLQIWSHNGPLIVDYRTIWGVSSSFNVTVMMNEDLSKLISTHSREKATLEVKVGKEEPFEGNQYGSRHGFRKCNKVSVSVYTCDCELKVCSVFVTIKVRDRSIIADYPTLKLCEIYISSA